MAQIKALKKLCFSVIACFLSLLAPHYGLTQEAAGLNLDQKTRLKVVQPSIIERLEQGESTVDVMVLLAGYQDYVGRINADRPEEMKTQQAEIRRKQDVILNRFTSDHFILKYRYDNILGFAGSISRHGLEAIASMPEVVSIEEDGKVEAQDVQGMAIMNGSLLPPSYDGSGVSIAVTDTGIDYMHPMLGGAAFPNSKVIGGYDFGDNDGDPVDCYGHGTSVAGIAAGTRANGPGDYIGGVANNAKLYAIKIVSGCGSTSAYSTIAKAWDWAVTHKNDSSANPIAIINTSFGGDRYYSACDASQPTLATSAINAVANGITIFASSGNNGYSDSLSAPACLSNVVSVGAVDDTYGQVMSYSNSANFLNILSPSDCAYTTALSGGYTSCFNGTSAATPYAAGTGALLQSYAKLTTGHFLSPADLKIRLTIAGDATIDPKNGIAKPRVNILGSYATSLFTLSCSHPPVRIGSTYYNTLQDAYNAAPDGATIQSIYGVFTENLNINRNISVTMSGGYNCGFPSQLLGNSTISGTISTSAGRLTFVNFATKN